MRTFYDLTCPFCYLAQPLNKQLMKSGVNLIELPFQAHPEIPTQGHYIGPRRGPMYDSIIARAKASGLPLRWRHVLPNSRLALAAAEWTRQHESTEIANNVRERLFYAHFAGDRDIGDRDTVVEILEQCGVNGVAIKAALEDGSALQTVDEAEGIGKGLGVASTPTWENDGVVVSGLQETQVRKLASQMSN